MTTKRMPRALAVWRLYSSKNCLTSWRSWFISPGDARKTWYSATLRGFKAIVIPLGFVPTRCRHGILPYSKRVILSASHVEPSSYQGHSSNPVTFMRGKGGSAWPRWDTDDGMSTDIVIFELSPAHPHYLTHPPGFRLEIWQAEELP